MQLIAYDRVTVRGGGGGGEGGFTSSETAVVLSGRSVNLTTLFLGRLSAHTHMCTSLISGRKKDRRKDSIIIPRMYVAASGIEPATQQLWSCQGCQLI